MFEQFFFVFNCYFGVSSTDACSNIFITKILSSTYLAKTIKFLTTFGPGLFLLKIILPKPWSLLYRRPWPIACRHILLQMRFTVFFERWVDGLTLYHILKFCMVRPKIIRKIEGVFSKIAPTRF